MAGNKPHKAAVIAALAALSLALCRADSPAATAARLFYGTLDAVPFDEAALSELMLPGSGSEELERSFGSLESWAGRVTKNGIMWRAEVIEERVGTGRVSLELVVLFNDGTRRRDRLGLVHSGDRWLVDMATVAGFASPAAQARD